MAASLAEHELPDKARNPEAEAEAEATAAAAAGASGSGASAVSGSRGHDVFPRAANTLGAGRGGLLGIKAATSPPAQSGHREYKIGMLVGLGAMREYAIALLDAAARGGVR